MHDTIARDKNTIPTMSEPKKWHPTKKKRKELNGGHMEFIQNMGGFHARVSMPTSSSCQVCSSR